MTLHTAPTVPQDTPDVSMPVHHSKEASERLCGCPGCVLREIGVEIGADWAGWILVWLDAQSDDLGLGSLTAGFSLSFPLHAAPLSTRTLMRYRFCRIHDGSGY